MPFIVLEGVDGAGKSTQLAKLTELLQRRGADYRYLHFPRFDTPVYGDLIARFLRGELGSVEQVNPYLVALIFAGDRADAAPMMKQWLEQGKFVITDRFVYSNIAFQCAKIDDFDQSEALRRWIMELEFGHNKLPRPEASLFLDVPIDFVASRLSVKREGEDREYLQGSNDIHEESIELQRRVREIYLRCAAEDSTLSVVSCADAQGRMDTPDNIFSRIEAVIEPLLGSI